MPRLQPPAPQRMQRYSGISVCRRVGNYPDCPLLLPPTLRVVVVVAPPSDCRKFVGLEELRFLRKGKVFTSYILYNIIILQYILCKVRTRIYVYISLIYLSIFMFLIISYDICIFTLCALKMCVTARWRFGICIA